MTVHFSLPTAAPLPQVNAAPPVPALRLVVVSNLFAEAFMVTFHLAPKLLLAWVQRQRQRRQRRRLADGGGGLPVTAAAQQPEGEEKPAAKKTVDSCCTSEDGASGGSSSGGQPESQQQGGACPVAAAEAGQGAAPSGPGGSGSGGAKPRLAPAPSTVRPPVPLLRGLSRKMEQWEEERPVLRRRLALAAITVTFMGCCSLQILAPGFVDVSIGELHCFLALMAKKYMNPAWHQALWMSPTVSMAVCLPSAWCFRAWFGAWTRRLWPCSGALPAPRNVRSSLHKTAVMLMCPPPPPSLPKLQSC